MGYGSWDHTSYTIYAYNTGRSVTSSGNLASSYTAQDIFKARGIDAKLSPYKVMRECKDTDEHPNTLPVILALDVTGSMGPTAAEVAKKLNELMTQIFSTVPDVEFMIMGIGDVYCDSAPIQVSQFESDVRIAEWTDKIFFERGGGGNGFESYTAAWYMGLKHCELDCWKRGKKGIIITLGDEPLNPYMQKEPLMRATGDALEGDIETASLYPLAKEKFDIYHIAVNDEENCYRYYKDLIASSFGKYLDDEHLIIAKLDEIIQVIAAIVMKASIAQGTNLNFGSKYEATTVHPGEGMPVISW